MTCLARLVGLADEQVAVRRSIAQRNGDGPETGVERENGHVANLDDLGDLVERQAWEATHQS